MTKQNYHYPIDLSWNHQEIKDVINFFTVVEDVYEQGVDYENVLMSYKTFKNVVPSKSEERQISRDFEEVSGYSIYRVVTSAKELKQQFLEIKTPIKKSKKRLKL
ncbi:UPF0223 family protein [Atopobacter phocae]|uniref:UPF0223 family protein n=1 Tax=Atopobacter phocae TaxID=136492 RepID=UPI0004703E6D|nr:UPF0223 family protein [Atopobacter phocae]